MAKASKARTQPITSEDGGSSAESGANGQCHLNSTKRLRCAPITSTSRTRRAKEPAWNLSGFEPNVS